MFTVSRRIALRRNPEGCKAEGEAKGDPLASPDNAAEAGFRLNPKGREGIGRIAVLLAPCWDGPNRVTRALHCIPMPSLRDRRLTVNTP